MNDKYFDLDPDNKTQAVKVLQIIFGILCIIATLYYLITGTLTGTTGTTLLATILFLLIFGIYQVMSGLGKTKKYFRIAPEGISFKQHSVLPETNIRSETIEKIELYPLSIKFFLKNGKKVKFRFGISYPEIIDPVKQEVTGFAEDLGIPWIEVPEEI